MATARSLELARRLWGWRPHSDLQRDFMLSQARVKTAACGRRWGKSESMAVDIVLDAIATPGLVQWILAPTSDQTQIIMDEVARRLYSIPAMGDSFSERRSPYYEFVFCDGKGLKEPASIRSRTVGTKGKGLRGRRGHKVVIDEAAFVPDAIVDNVITPILADFDGQLVKISSPDGVGTHFHDTFLRGVPGSSTFNPRYASFQCPTASNPYIPRAYLDNERATKPELVYAQEYDAQFLDREGAVFRKIMLAATLEPIFADGGLYVARERVPGHQYVGGADWARSNDFTVLAVFDITARELVALDRFNQIHFETQRTRLKALHGRYDCVTWVAEQNSIGLPNIEALQADDLPVQPFLTTNATKAELVDTLALALERMDLKLPNVAPMTQELMAYRGVKLPSGLMQYGAPAGKHDDVVMGTMLAVWGAANSGASVGPDIWG